MNVKAPERPMGDRFRRAREDKGWLQADVSRETGLSQGYISQVETGSRAPSKTAIAVLCFALGIDGDERARLMTTTDSSWFLRAPATAAA